MASVENLRRLCNQFRWHCNHERLHRSLGERTSANAYSASAKVKAGSEKPKRKPPKTSTVQAAGSSSYRQYKINIGQRAARPSICERW